MHFNETCIKFIRVSKKYDFDNIKQTSDPIHNCPFGNKSDSHEFGSNQGLELGFAIT